MSNLSKDSQFYSEENHRRPGTYKNECPQRIITEFIALRSKVYCLKFDDENQRDDLRLKGLPRVVTRTLTFKNYFDALFNEDESKRKRAS